MKKKEEENKRFLKTLQEILSIESNEIDEENKNLSEDIKKEEKIKQENISENKDNYLSEKNLSEKLKNKNIKESIQYPLESYNDKKEENTKISKDEKNIINSFENEEKYCPLKSALCKIHGKSYLKVNNSFQIICEKCIEENKISQLKIINNYNEKNIDDEEEKKRFNCFEHQNIKGSFYCDDCKEFICKMCFADIHREHKCHLPRIIRNEFDDYINKEIDNSSKLGPILNDSVNNVKKIYDSLKEQKDNILKIPKNVMKVVSLNNEKEIEEIKKKIKEKFIGIDNDINDDFLTFKNIKEKGKKFLEILDKISNEINSKNNNYIICGYHKEKTKFLNEISNFLNSSFNFINIRLKSTNSKYLENEEKIENSLNLMNKEIINYEKSSISAISTGRENRNIVFLRYSRFVHRQISYFKNSLIGFASNDNIFLTGLVICGLYIKRKNKNNIDEQSNNNSNENFSEIIKIPIQITVSTMINKVEGEKLFSQKSELTNVKSEDDKGIIIHFEKGVKIAKEKLYLIKVENLSENIYTDIWLGSIGKNYKKSNFQVIRCHNTGIQFLFKKTKEIQTDFDEFEEGIIDGILYSINK